MSTAYDLDHILPNRLQRPELACDDAWIREFLGRAQVGYVATRWEEQPFITPTTFWYDPESHVIYFHSAPVGRLRANIDRHDQVCFAASQSGRLLPSNVALEFSIQYESVVAFGCARLLRKLDEKRLALYGLIEKYFPDMRPGEQYRPITDAELKQTAVYAMAIDSWSGKRNWPDQAEQSPDWPSLSKDRV
jgi:nitroimidazol reductase NimA-like FMN-containing flavoprotein (pyridoxamine 5'-phosphate oxidase superfamily)